MMLSRTGQRILAVTAYAVLAFLVLPVLVVVPLSFTPGTVFAFPPEGVSFRWYGDYFGDARWMSATWLSLRLAVTVALVSTTLGAAGAIALTRYLDKGASLVRGLLLAPLVVPAIVTAVAVFDVYARVGLLRTFTGLVVAHTILALPFSLLLIESALRSVDFGPYEAAVSLGARELVAWRIAVFPAIRPAVVGSAIFAFLISWDEVVLAVFIGGARAQTLPLRMFEFIQTQIRPTLAAISSLIVYVIAAVVVLTIVRGGRDGSSLDARSDADTLR
jgi:ABC-type spermidine/putrescine transport system permease subunit II